MFSVSLHKVFTRFSHTVAGILAHSSMQISSRAVMFWDFQLPPKIFYGVEIWRLARPLQDLEMLLTEPLLRCPGGVFGIIVMLKDSATFHLQCPCWWKEVYTQNLTIHGPIHSFLYTDQSSWSLCRKTAPKHDVSTPMLHSRYGVLWMQLRNFEFLPKSYILVSSDHMTFSQSSSGSSKCSLANFRRAWTCTGLSRGTRLALQDLSPWRRSVLLMVAFVTLVPALCRSFTRSPRVVLGFLLTVLVIILTPRGEILRGAPDRGRLSVVLYVFHFLIIAPTVDFFTPSCLPIADSVFPAWCRSTILFLVSFDSSLVLAIVERLESDWLRLWTGVFYTDNEFKQMPLIQVTSGGQRSLLKMKLQVCESQQSCLFVGDQILIFHHN